MRYVRPTERRSFDPLLARLADSPTTLSERELLEATHWNLCEDARLREDVRFRETPWGRWMRAEDLIANDATYRWLHAERRSAMSVEAALQRASELFGRRCVICPDDPRFVLRHDDVCLVASELSSAPVVNAEIGDLEKYTTHLPLHSLKAAAASEPAGQWGPAAQEQAIETLGWVRVSLPGRRLNDRMFVAQVEGHSMDDGKSGLVDGGYAVFELWPSGTHQALNVLVRGAFHDPETGSYAVKKFVADQRDEHGRHHRVALVSLNPDKQRYPDIELDVDDEDAVKVVATVVYALASNEYERQPKRKRTVGRRRLEGAEGLAEQGTRLARRIATFFDGAPPDPDDDDVETTPGDAGWSPRLVCLDAAAGGLHVELGPLSGLPSFVKKLRLVGNAAWDALVIAANARERRVRVALAVSKGPWRCEAVGFEDESDLGLARLAIEGLSASAVTVFRVDADGIGQRQEGTQLALGQAYRLLVPPSLATPEIGVEQGEGWRLWSIDLALPVAVSTRASLAGVGLAVGEAWPRLEWALASPAAWPTNARGDSYPVFEAGDEVFVNVRGVTPDDVGTLFVQGAEATERFALAGDGVVSLGVLPPGRWACALIHPRTSVPTTTLMFEISEYATRTVGAAWSAIAPAGVTSLQITAPPGWPVALRWRDASGESLVATVHAGEDGSVDLDEVRPRLEQRAKRVRIADLLVELDELGRQSIEHDGRVSIDHVRATLAELWQTRSAVVQSQVGAWMNLVPHWFEPVAQLFGYGLEAFADGALPMSDAHGLAAWRLTVEERLMGAAISRSTSRVLVLTTDLAAALGSARTWIETACRTANVREALVTDGVRWTMHRRGNRLRGQVWNLGEDLEQRAEQMLADLGEGIG